MKVYAVPKYLFNAELAKIVARAIVLRLKGIQDKKRKAEEAWKEYIKIVTPHEDRFRRILKKLFKAQEQEVLRNMRRSSKSLVITKDKIDTWLFDEKEWKEKFGQAEEDFLAGLATEVGNQTVESLPVVGMMFDVNNPNLRKRMDKRVGEFKGVVDTTTRKIRDSLTAGIDAGESIDELADRVINVFKDASYNRAEMIARTETIWGSNAATESTYMQSGVVEGKEWQVALDGRLCEFCMHMYEHYGPGKGGLGLGERFFEQGDSLQVGEGESRSELVFNYEPIEHPPLHPRCRCVLVGTLIDLDKLIGDLEDQIEGDFFTFKNKSDYLKYKKYMDEYYERVRLLPDDVVAPILRREMKPLIEMTKLLESWQGAASSRRAIRLRCVAKELENYSYDIWIREQGRDKVDRIMREVRQKLEEFRIPYLKMRAITQAYFKRMGKKTIVLSRGIDGRTGKIWREKIREYLERGEKYINIEENNLAGWTSSDNIAEKFGINEGGIVVSHNFDVRDILVHHDVWPKTMYLNEEETIVFSGVRKYKMDEIRLE